MRSAEGRIQSAEFATIRVARWVRRQLRLVRGLCSAELYAPRGRARGINPRATVGKSGSPNRKSRSTHERPALTNEFLSHLGGVE